MRGFSYRKIQIKVMRGDTHHGVESVCSSLKLATLIKIEGANHAFKAGKQNILQLLADTTRDWMEKMIKKA